MTSFSLLSAANRINAQSIAWVNPSELKRRVNTTAMIDTHDGRQYALCCWPLPVSPATGPCQDHTWSHHKATVPCRCIPSSCSPPWEPEWLRFTLQCCSSSFSPLPWKAQLPDLWSTSTTKNGYFVWPQRKKHAVGSVLHIRFEMCRLRCEIGSSLNGAQLENTLPAAIWGSTELWKDPIFMRPSSNGAKRVCTHLLRYLTCSIKSRVWIWEAESTVCPTIYLYLNLTQRLV